MIPVPLQLLETHATATAKLPTTVSYHPARTR
jgi:hypothetical protein